MSKGIFIYFGSCCVIKKLTTKLLWGILYIHWWVITGDLSIFNTSDSHLTRSGKRVHRFLLFSGSWNPLLTSLFAKFAIVYHTQFNVFYIWVIGWIFSLWWFFILRKDRGLINLILLLWNCFRSTHKFKINLLHVDIVFLVRWLLNAHPLTLLCRFMQHVLIKPLEGALTGLVNCSEFSLSLCCPILSI